MTKKSNHESSTDFLFKNIRKLKLKKSHGRAGVITLAALTLEACGGGGPTAQRPIAPPPPPPPPPVEPGFDQNGNTYTARNNEASTLEKSSETNDLTVNGKAGAETINTGAGNDTIDAGGGNDIINRTLQSRFNRVT